MKGDAYTLQMFLCLKFNFFQTSLLLQSFIFLFSCDKHMSEMCVWVTCKCAKVFMMLSNSSLHCFVNHMDQSVIEQTRYQVSDIFYSNFVSLSNRIPLIVDQSIGLEQHLIHRKCHTYCNPHKAINWLHIIHENKKNYTKNNMSVHRVKYKGSCGYLSYSNELKPLDQIYTGKPGSMCLRKDYMRWVITFIKKPK